MKPRKVGVVANPNSGSTKNGTVQEVKGEFESAGHEVILLWTEPGPDSVANLIRQATEAGCDLIVVVGGDGTVCMAAAALAGSDVTMAVYPGGTGNLWARSFYSVPTPKRFVRMVLRGIPQRVDIIRLQYKGMNGVDQDIKYLVGMGLGKISDAISDADPKHKRIFGKLVYVVQVTIACLKRQGNRFEITAGDQTIESNDGLALFALNVAPPSMATLSRGCNAFDEKLDLVLFTGVKFREVLRTVWSLVSGRPDRLDEAGYEKLRAPEISIKIFEPLRPNVDGDPTEAADPAYPLRLTVEKQAISMVLSA